VYDSFGFWKGRKMNFQNKVVVITGENICIDGGQTKLMVYHGDHGWRLE